MLDPGRFDVEIARHIHTGITHNIIHVTCILITLNNVRI